MVKRPIYSQAKLKGIQLEEFIVLIRALVMALVIPLQYRFHIKRLRLNSDNLNIQP